MTLSWRLALVALAACGGGKTEPAVVTIPPASSSAKPIASAPPPVASVASAVDAGPEPSATVGACEETCGGVATPALEQALVARVKKARRCYEVVLAKDPTYKGKFRIDVRVAADGKSCRAVVGQSSASGGKASADSDVPECMAAFFRDQPFPPPKGGCVDVNIPVNLTQAAPKP